jgi:amino acid adenylation domain-containing protein
MDVTVCQFSYTNNLYKKILGTEYMQKILTCPLSENQQGIFFETIRTSHPVYISQMCLTFKGKFDYQMFQQAYCLVIKRHGILRASFSIDKTTPVQIIYEDVEPVMVYHDYLELQTKERNKQYNLFLDTDLITTFNFDQPCLMRLTIIRFSNKEYRVIWTRHHILLDGSSVRLILNELLTIYDALLNNKTWELPPSSSYLSIKDKFCLQDQNSAMQYWKQQLKIFKKSSSLPTVKLRHPSIQGYSQLNSTFSGEHYLKLANFISEHELTINSILQSAWGIVLSHYSNNEHIIFGSVRAYPKKEIKNCAGLFINTLPLSLTVHAKMNVLNFLKSVRELGKALRKYTHTSLSDIRKWCGLALDELLYQSIVDYRPYSINKIIKTEFSNLDCKISLRLTTPYPLVLEVVNEGDHLDIQLNYSTDLFTQQFTQEILNHFQDIIRELCLYPSRALFELPTLTQMDKQKSVIDWNKTKRIYPLNKTLHQLFEEQVKKTPNADAILYKDVNLSYEMLNKKANQLAHFIIKASIKPEPLIVILTDPNINIIISLLAILKTGGAYVPIDINYPLERIKYLINDSCAELIICDNKTNQMFSQIIASLNKATILINLDTIPLQSFCSTNPEIKIPSSNLAYMIYTSGSTGTPKGVLVEHRSVLNMALGCIERLEVIPESRILQIASFGFDVAVAEWTLALLSGATLCLMDKGIFNPNSIVEALEFYNITTIILASSILATLPQRNIPSLKVIAVGGEPCSEAVINFWARNRLFLNVYGITETTVCSTIGNCYPEQAILSIGRPLPNTQIYILNEYQQPLPIGVCGEIYVGGIGVARGYWKKADLTREKFVKNPLIDQSIVDHSYQNDRLYKTGDKGRWLPNGELEFLGRVDDQIKIMGIRVELTEIEKAIEQHPAIEKAAVIFTSVNNQLQAFVLSPFKNLDLEMLKQFLKTILPHTLIPHRFQIIDELPLTSNGKINKAELIKYHPIEKESVNFKKEKLTSTEEIIFFEIQNIMGFKNISVQQNFLDIGLKSIDLVNLSVKLRTLFNQEVSVISLFNYPTIKTLAYYLDELKFSHKATEKFTLRKSLADTRSQVKVKRINFEK